MTCAGDPGFKSILVALGTRPEAIKLAPVILELKRPENKFKTIVCATGQHREMLAQTLDSFRLRPDYNLGVMRPDQSLTDVTTAVLSGIDKVLEKEKPDVVLVQGDTTTTFAASLAAYYHRTRVGHIEAGLRTGDRYNPFPEELNRRLATHIADFHFAPTELARDNLLREGIRDEQILISGNTVVDALYYILANLTQNPPRTLIDVPHGQRLILVTAHRRESFGHHMQQICEAIRRLAESRSDVLVVFPVHLNPNVQRPVRKMLKGLPNLVLLDPLDYVSFVAMMERAYILLTDSGGMQEEGPSLQKPVLVMRTVSERPEALMAGAACLVGTDPSRIIATVDRLLDDPHYYEQMTRGVNPFGDGKAAARIVSFLSQNLSSNVSEAQPELPERVK